MGACGEKETKKHTTTTKTVTNTQTIVTNTKEPVNNVQKNDKKETTIGCKIILEEPKDQNPIDTKEIGIIIEDDSKNKKTIQQSNKQISIICPNCKGRYLQIQEIYYNTQTKGYRIKYRCQCEKNKEKETDISNCLKDDLTTTSCPVHKNLNLLYYCSQCNMYICDNCKKDQHINHNCKTFNELFNSNIKNEYQNDLKSNLDQLKLKKEDFIKQSEQERKYLNSSIDNLIKKLQAVKENSNKEIELYTNKQLQIFDSLIPIYQNSIAQIQSNSLNITNLEELNFLSAKNLFSNQNQLQTNSQLIIKNIFDNPSPSLQINYDFSIQNTNHKYSPFSLDKNITGHTDKVIAIIQLQNGNLATGSYDQTIRFWNITSLKEIEDKRINENGYVLTLLEMDSNLLLSGTSDNTISCWDITTKRLINTYYGHELWVNCLVKLNNDQFASCSNDYSIRIWNFKEKKLHSILKGHTDCILTLILLKNNFLCSGAADNSIRIWDWVNNKCVFTSFKHTKWVKCLCQLDNGDIISGSDDKSIKIWRNNECISSLYEHEDSVRSLCNINSKIFASGGFDNKINIYDSKNYKKLQILEGHKENVISIIRLVDGRIASCSNDKTIKIWKC